MEHWIDERSLWIGRENIGPQQRGKKEGKADPYFLLSCSCVFMNGHGIVSIGWEGKAKVRYHGVGVVVPALQVGASAIQGVIMMSAFTITREECETHM